MPTTSGSPEVRRPRSLPGLFFVAFAILIVLVTVPVARAPQGDSRSPAREDAYRSNNIGVARLEQYDYPAAAQAFRRALELAKDLTIARVNLAIALFYAGELEPARREAEAARKAPDAPLQAEYVLGLIARAESRSADAIAAFNRVRQADPNDVGSAVNLGQLLLQEQKFTEAVDAFRRATELEPYHSTAAYGLATALLRSGARDEGTAAMARFQKLRDSGYATTFSQNYLEQGRYAAAIASTGAEPDLVDPGVPQVRFVDATREMIPERGDEGAAGGPTLFDLDGDGDLDLALATARGVRLFRNESGRLSETSGGLTVQGSGASTAAVAGDFDNDERPDLLVLSGDGARLFRQQPNRSFADVTAASGLPRLVARTAAWSDADHDGDLDIVSPPFLLRNNGNGTFADVSTAAGVSRAGAALAIAPTDFDNRRDVDYLVLRKEDAPAAAQPLSAPMLLQNMRDGTFRDVAQSVGLTRAGDWTTVASADVNKDGFTDFFLSRMDGPGMLVVSDGQGRFTVTDAPGETTRALASQFLDYDNDGLLDLLVVTGAGAPTLLRNAGTGWLDATATAFGKAAPAANTAGRGAIASGDLDGDGDTDAVTWVGSGLRVWRNEGGHRRRSLNVRLSARVSNRSSAGSRVEMRAGSLTQLIETSAATPATTPADVLFGLGDRPGADVVRVLWPAGILQAEVAPDAKPLAGTTIVRELDRKPSSCPYLYTWNGSRFEFVTDFLGGGEMGYWVAPDIRNTPDSDEYVRIDSRQLRPRNGRYELRITNELEEALFLDRAQLVAVDHPAGIEVYPNEGMGTSPRPFELFLVQGAGPPPAAVDEHGHDVLDRLRSIDRRYVDDFELERVRGYARPHAVSLELPPHRDGDRLLLLLTGWTDYAFSRDNVAASQQGLKLEPPSLEVKESNGQWRTIVENIGVPVGRPQTVPVDLTNVLPAGATHVRIRTTMRIYWDAAMVDIGQASGVRRQASGDSVALQRLDPLTASLTWRGFSAEASPDGREPFLYDYAKVSAQSPWKLMPGRYTREGDVRALLTTIDDMFVVSRPGDEIALSFDATRLGEPKAGWTRTFLLYADGFSKEMDHHSASPDQLAPLPFHRMTRYPYSPPERYPDGPAHREYQERYNTRVVPRAVPPIELASPSHHQDR